ncbi:MAG: hypothetical protein ACI8RD_010771 [Bacillariaceae sp.]|jgi:hypothetical protein
MDAHRMANTNTIKKQLFAGRNLFSTQKRRQYTSNLRNKFKKTEHRTEKSNRRKDTKGDSIVTTKGGPTNKAKKRCLTYIR